MPFFGSKDAKKEAAALPSVSLACSIALAISDTTSNVDTISDNELERCQMQALTVDGEYDTSVERCCAALGWEGPKKIRVSWRDDIDKEIIQCARSNRAFAVVFVCKKQNWNSARAIVLGTRRGTFYTFDGMQVEPCASERDYLKCSTSACTKEVPATSDVFAFRALSRRAPIQQQLKQHHLPEKEAKRQNENSSSAAATSARSKQTFRTITGTTSQYRAGGQAACTVIAIAAAERILGQAELTPAVIDAAVREGAEYRGTEQLVADEQISDQKWERFDFGQHSNAASMFRDLRQPDAAGGAPCAYVVTKPPETVVLLWLPARFLQKGADDVNATGPVWVLVDSHPRPEHGLASAYALVFDSFSALRDTMLQRQPFISSGIEDAWMYDVCEHIGIRLKKTDETSNAAVKAKEKDISRPSSISVTSACSWQGQRFNSAEGLCQQLGSTVDSATKCAVLQAELARVREALPGCIESIADKRAADLVTQLAILGERLGGHERKVRGPSDGTGGSR